MKTTFSIISGPPAADSGDGRDCGECLEELFMSMG
jgi:hypothetical protein